ncbi:MAG: trypsin-like peptidase domain-containing protein [Acidobacteriota bacterium]
MYKISARQLILLAIIPAIIAGVLVACAQRLFNKTTPSEGSLEPTVIADPSVVTDEQNNIEVYRAVSPGVVFITNTSYVETWYGIYPQEGSGSGSIIDDQGRILTNYHVVQNSSQLEVQINNDKYPARLIGSDRDNDLAIIQVEAPRDKLTVVKLGSSKDLQVGQKVLAIGNPFGLQRTLTTGVISGLERPLRDSAAKRTIQGAIQTDASINPGNSGGPLLNARGELIGINTAIYSPNGGGSVGIGFAVPVDTAKKIIPELIAKGHVSRPWLGVDQSPINRGLARRLGLSTSTGLMVTAVYRGTGAAQAGLRAAVIEETFFNTYLRQVGDIILSVDGKPVANNEDVENAIKDKKPGQTVELEVLRQNNRGTVSIKLSERPPDAR